MTGCSVRAAHGGSSTCRGGRQRGCGRATIHIQGRRTSPHSCTDFQKKKKSKQSLGQNLSRERRELGYNWGVLLALAKGSHSCSKQAFAQSFCRAAKLCLHVEKDLSNTMEQIAAPSVAAALPAINVSADAMNSKQGWMQCWMQYKNRSPCQHQNKKR